MNSSQSVRMVCRRSSSPPDRASIRFLGQSGLTSKMAGTLENGGWDGEHASTRSTQLYDRRHDAVSLDKVERIAILLVTHERCSMKAAGISGTENYAEEAPELLKRYERASLLQMLMRPSCN